MAIQAHVDITELRLSQLCAKSDGDCVVSRRDAPKLTEIASFLVAMRQSCRLYVVSRNFAPKLNETSPSLAALRQS